MFFIDKNTKDVWKIIKENKINLTLKCVKQGTLLSVKIGDEINIKKDVMNNLFEEINSSEVFIPKCFDISINFNEAETEYSVYNEDDYTEDEILFLVGIMEKLKFQLLNRKM